MAETTMSRVQDETLHEYITRQWQSLMDERASWRAHWEELTKFSAPRHGRYTSTDRNKGRKKNNAIIDGAATMAGRTLVAGMQSGLTSPARPWMRYKTSDPDLMDYAPVREWLARADMLALRILAKSNFYNAIQQTYSELGHFGTNVLYRERDFRTVLRFHPFTVGSYAIAEDDSGRVDVCYREFELTVRQCVQKFGLENCSQQIRQNWDDGNYNIPVTIVHAMEPNVGRDIRSRDARNMPYRSVYIEHGSRTPIKTQQDESQALRISGYRSRPFYGVRWDILFGDVYGRSPGMDALGDVKQMQTQQRRKGQGIDKQVNPPLRAHPSLKGNGFSLLPGSVNYVESRNGVPGIEPIYQTQVRIADLTADMAEVRDRVNKWYYADLFAMMIESDRREITATEVSVRQQEKLVLLGPVLQRLNSELFDPLLEDIFSIMVMDGMLPEPPEELRRDMVAGVPDVEYTSLLQQAQQAVGVNAIDRFFGFVAGVGEVQPQIWDKVDVDAAADEYADVLGVPTDVVRSDAEAQQVRQQRAQAEQAMVQAEQAAQQAATAKTLSETQVGESNALDELLSGVGPLAGTA